MRDWGSHLNSADEVQQDVALFVGGDVLHVLHDQVSGGTDTPDRQEDVVVHEVCGQALDLLGEGGAEEQGLPLACRCSLKL